MTVREDTINKLNATDITKWVDRPTHASVETTRKELTKKSAAIKTGYDAFPLGTRFGYATVIILTEYYKERVDKIEPPSNWRILGPSSRRSNPKRMTRPSMERRRH